MQGAFWLNWAQAAAALGNTILMLWLGLTVLLAAERRTWGIWLAGGGLCLGAVFFIGHTAILSLGPVAAGRGLEAWWRAGWAIVVVLPGAWYVLMAWYTGFWGASGQAHSAASQRALRRRQRPWLILAALLALALTGLFMLGVLPSLAQATGAAWPGAMPRRSTLLLLLYPPYVVLCIGLSLDALRSPGPSERWQGDLARRRARPWFRATALLLLAVGLLVAAGLGWWGFMARDNRPAFGLMAQGVAWFDLASALLIAAAAVCLGQAIVTYEVFTGKTLPRHGLRRYWRNALILAAGYGVVVGWCLAGRIPPVYSLLISAILMTAFYALLGWRSFAERERTMAGLRPFVTSHGLAEQLLDQAGGPAPAANIWRPFQALCSEVLNAGVATLAALGPMAPLAGPAFSYPSGERGDLSWLDGEAAARLAVPGQLSVPVDPRRWGGAAWAIPLWNERGLIGVLLLGHKRDGGLYAQEEIEIARAAGERLIDMAAGTALANRLMALQRQRLAESQVLDQRTRRALHDDVLPRLHAAMLALGSSAGEPAADEALTLLTGVHRQLAAMLRAMPAASVPGLATMGLPAALRRVVEDELADAFDEVSWQVGSDMEPGCAALPAWQVEVLFGAAREALRNAARHARPVDSLRPLQVQIRMRAAPALSIVIEDNGCGPHGTNEGPGGTGQGLALHSTLMAVIGGALELASQPGVYTRVTLTLPPHQELT